MRDRDATLMDVARIYEQQSTCSRNHVGTVIALDGRVIGTGYNGAPAGMPHCDHTCRCAGFLESRVTFAQHAETCPKSSPCLVSVHAEANAIAFCAKHGLPTNGATLYTTLSPCYPCAQLIINSGLTRVVFDRVYRDSSGVDLLEQAGVELG
jgi:dCMP deaminase